EHLDTDDRDHGRDPRHDDDGGDPRRRTRRGTTRVLHQGDGRGPARRHARGPHGRRARRGRRPLDHR
ncbi:MAG: Acetoin dehydrogenase E1 component beta-subunit, partial [uncultured Frankineae bacterium]